MQKSFFPSSMASLLQLLPFLCLHWLIVSASTSSNQIPKHYIVYMGSSSNTENGDVEVAESAHLQLLSSIIPSEESDRISLIYHYKHAFKGFSAMLTEKEASLLSGHDEVVSVFPDGLLELHTTRSWDFLEEAVKRPITSPGADYKYYKKPSDVIIGVIDTGIWPESESFNDEGMSEIPSRWKGVCMEASDFKKSNCNRKLIGARFYKTSSYSTDGSPRDHDSHGTHCASTVAGAPVANASYFGLAQGTARGGSPSSRIASYQACLKSEGCLNSALLKSFDDAINDGVDIISISIGSTSHTEQSDFLSDPIGIGAFHAEQHGVMVISSAGNSGPHPSTVVNTAPWIFTIAATSIDRDFQATVVLGNGKTIRGSAISFSSLSQSETYPLAFGKDIAADSASETEARGCHPGSLDSNKVEGKIIVCIDNDSSISRAKKTEEALSAQAIGLINVNEVEKFWPFETGHFPYTEVGNSQGLQIIKYIQSTTNPTATILQSVTVLGYKPAPVVAYFSSRGPGLLTQNILKPDISAPGVAILAAIVPKGHNPSNYGLKSGTSMACPHVSGAAAFIKSQSPNWTSSIIRSALMTTANVYDNIGKPLINNSGYYANPHEMGVGEINPLKALNPGLVFETTMKDYLKFLCYYGYSTRAVKSVSKTKFSCPRQSNENLISNINYPSISISKLGRYSGIRTVIRTVTNLGPANSVYTASVKAPLGLVVNVNPKKIVFSKGVRRVSFKVSFYSKGAASGYNFGSITWFRGQHRFVQMIFAVNVE